MFCRSIIFVFFISLLYATPLHAQSNDGVEDIDWHRIIRSGDIVTLQQWIESSSDLAESTDKRGRTLLRIAIEENQFYIIRYLLKSSLDINQPSRDGQTALHVAAYSHDLQNVELLLVHGADPNIPNLSGETPLYQAVFFGYGEIALAMLKQGGDLEISNHDGDTPLTHAPQQTILMIDEFLNKKKNVQQKKQAQKQTQALAQQQQQQQQQEAFLQQAREEQQQRWQALQAHQEFIARMSSPKKRDLRWVYKQLTEEYALNIDSKSGAALTLTAIFTPLAAPPLSPAFGFVPVNQELELEADFMAHVNNGHTGAAANFLNLYDRIPPVSHFNEETTIDGEEVESTPAPPQDDSGELSKELSKLQDNRKKSIEKYTNLFIYDSVLLALGDLSLESIFYDADTQKLTVTLQSSHSAQQHAFIVNDIAEPMAQNFIENPENVAWHLTYQFKDKDFTHHMLFTTPWGEFDAAP